MKISRLLFVLLGMLGILCVFTLTVPQFRFVFLRLLVAEPTEQEVAELMRLRIELQRLYGLAEATPGNTNSPSFSWRAGAADGVLERRHQLRLYGLTRQDKQDEIISFVRAYKHENDTNPVRIRFYRSENWIYTNALGSGYRGDEKLLRSIVVK